MCDLKNLRKDTFSKTRFLFDKRKCSSLRTSCQVFERIEPASIIEILLNAKKCSFLKNL